MSWGFSFLLAASIGSELGLSGGNASWIRNSLQLLETMLKA